ncbi:MAG TPA: MBL fold metallo-hydrolase [Candidatus Polarisedimenticolia bacterium]|jgi:glyoxylase-like metal-dependent hydrolase (beta-lactamase superfamily II)
MRLIQVEVGHMQNFNYLAGCGQTGEAALVDPAWEVDRMLERAAAEGLVVTHLLVTHTHHDHVEGLASAWSRTGAMIHVHELEAPAAAACLRAQGEDAGATAIREVVDGSVIDVGSLAIRVMHTPGHTPGAVCYLVPRGVITGDTLFVGRCGRTDFPGSDPEAMYLSLRRLSELPDDTIVYPGHNYADWPTSTIVRERTSNVHMSAPDREEFLRRRMGTRYISRIGGTRR